MIHQKFARTICACEACTHYCRHMPGMLAPGDIETIAEFVGATPTELASKLRASPGALVGIRGTGQTFRIGTIVPDVNGMGECVFLDAGGRCTIHPVAPFGCGWFDSHMDPREGDMRSRTALAEIAKSREYMDYWLELRRTGRVAPAPETLR